MRLDVLEREASAKLKLPLVIRRSDAGAAVALRRNERLRLSGMTRERRRHQWLLGRAALKQVMRALGMDDDTSAISFPYPRLSLTHSGNVSFAAGTAAPASGIGIDYEPGRNLTPGIARWFLQDEEYRWAESRFDRDATLLRLWTVKEAAFKCYPANAGMLLKDFSILDPAAPVLRLAASGDQPRIEVTSMTCETGWLSIAVCRGAALNRRFHTAAQPQSPWLRSARTSAMRSRRAAACSRQWISKDAK
jgi:phosphopantetheinyl transferase